jgi:hypothetical protein
MSRWLSGIRLPLARPMGVLSAHPRAKRALAQAGYRTLHDALIDEPGTLRLREITLRPASSDLLRLLRSAFSIGAFSVGAKDIVEVRLSGNTIKGVFIKDVLSYRL